ncbi:unnamed protein product [marine sediment metagenome]|uniref:Uncharacterized protein n=1 Tax=marine sediment metagenome TaxID=412755 RepID=X0VBP1_9ZZZZ
MYGIGDMDQQRRIESLPDVMRKALNVTMAADVLNRCINEIPVSMQAERVALAIYNKTVPSLAAVALEIHDDRPVNVHDLNAMLLSSGLPALDTPQAIESTVEKDDSA